MATHEHRLQKIRAHVQDAHDELHALPAEDRQPFESELARLENVVADAHAVLEAADPRLLSTPAFASIQSAACAISNDPRTALQAADAHAEALTNAVALLPVTRAEIHRQITAAAEAFHTSSVERLDTLRREIEAAAEGLRGLRAEVDRWSSSLEQQVERQVALDGKLAKAEETIASLDRRRSEAFAESESRRAAEFQAQLDAFRAEHARTQQEAIDEVQARVAEIRRMEEETAALVGAIGLDGTAEIYRRQGRRQRRAAEILRGLAVLAGLGAVGIALSGTAVTDPTAEFLVASLFAALMLAGLGAYLARQSGRHRAAEERTCALELELAAFGPFIEPLSPEQRDEERVIMARKLFPAPELETAPVSLALRRRRAAETLPVPASNGASANGSA
jgi:phage-related protein